VKNAPCCHRCDGQLIHNPGAYNGEHPISGEISYVLMFFGGAGMHTKKTVESWNLWNLQQNA
jgi:hypothetical protein